MRAMTSWPPEAPVLGPFDDTTPIPGLHADLHTDLSAAVGAILAELGGTAELPPRGTAADVTARLLAFDGSLDDVRARVDEVFEVLSSAAEGSNGDLLTRIDRVRSDLTTRINGVSESLTLTRSALGDLTQLRAGYATLVARLAARDPAAAVFGDPAAVPETWSTNLRTLMTCSVPDPGYPYRLQVQAQFTMGTDPATDASRWDLQAICDGGGQAEYVGDFSIPVDGKTQWRHSISSAILDPVHTGASRVRLRAFRPFGTANGRCNDLGNSRLRVARWRV